MKIQIVASHELLRGTPYQSGQIVEGTLADALRILGEIFVTGRSVGLTHAPVSTFVSGVHEIYPDSIKIWVE